MESSLTNPCDPNLPRHVSSFDHPLANPQTGEMTKHVNPFAPYAAPELSRGLRRNWTCILLSVVDSVIYSVGTAGAIYCLLMLICPEYPEGIASAFALRQRQKARIVRSSKREQSVNNPKSEY